MAHARLLTPSHIGSVHCTELISTYVRQQESFQAHKDRKFATHQGLFCFTLLLGEHRLH